MAYVVVAIVSFVAGVILSNLVKAKVKETVN